MLTLHFLGTGTSQGVPMMVCDCAVCRSADARDKRMRSSLWVRTPECDWVVDTGPDFRSQCLRAGVRRLEAAVFTHEHTDHVMGFDDLRRFSDVLGGEIPVHAPARTLETLRRAFGFAFTGKPAFPGYLKAVAHEVTGPFQLGGTTLTPLPCPHGAKFVTTGYLLSRGGERLAAYLSDVSEVPEAVAEAVRGVRTLVLDALRWKPHPTHLSVEQALEVVGRVGPGTTWLTHIGHELGHAETEAKLPPEVRLAYDGLEVTVGSGVGGE